MRHDFSRANTRDMNDNTRCMWTSAFDWDDAERLLQDPIGFFAAEHIPMRFGNPLADIILQFTATPDTGGPGDLIMEGMDDTNIIAIRVKRWSPDFPANEHIRLSHHVPIVVQMRPQDNLATIHFHLDDAVERDMADKTHHIYLMLRYPQLLVNELQHQVDAHHNYLTITGEEEQGPDEFPIAFVPPSVRTALIQWNCASRLSTACSIALGEVVQGGIRISQLIGRNYPIISLRSPIHDEGTTA